MANEMISYREMCQREGVNLQKGMNYQLGKGYSVILMSVGDNAPYRDYFKDDGSTLIYEGHDVQRRDGIIDPKSIDQPEFNPRGTLTENGKFHKAAQDYKQGLRPAEKVRVYEKIRPGVWSYNGVFELVDSWKEYDGKRKVFKFKLIAIEKDSIGDNSQMESADRKGISATSVKLELWKRDGGCA
ncbi:HNH endonuclease [Desulfosoma sp.]